jgi:hypothetical protein
MTGVEQVVKSDIDMNKICEENNLQHGNCLLDK